MKTINRRDFVNRLMRDCGMSFLQASQVFDAVCEVVADGVVSGARIRFGRLGVLQPVWRQPKAVHKGFRVTKGREIVKQKHVYFLGKRISYSLKIYKGFMNSHSLHWYSDHCDADEDSVDTDE